MRTRSRANSIRPIDGVSPPSSSAAQSSMRSAPPCCAASAESSELAAISSSAMSDPAARRQQRILRAGIAYRVAEARLQRPCAHFAGAVECEKPDLDLTCGFLAARNASHGFATCFVGRAALTHQFDHEETAGVADHFFTDTGR